MRLYSILLLCLAALGRASTQDLDCGSDLLFQRQLATDPVFKARHEAMEQARYQFVTTHKPSAGQQDASPATYVLPVVFHIIHQNGPENISDARIQQELENLNAGFANSGYYDQGDGVATPFQFCLARRTPDGLPTNGINRVSSPLTQMTFFDDDPKVKNLIFWDPAQYINIWVVQDILTPGITFKILGYSTLPASHGMPTDGIVLLADWAGFSEARSTVLIHEMGHFLGLFHTFQGGCNNFDCAISGDGVCDTPPDQSTIRPPCGVLQNSCNTDVNSGFTTDQNDLPTNYMDYIRQECRHSFTAGQSQRMEFLTSQYRLSLLESPACLEPCSLPLTAVFTLTPGSVVDAGTTVTSTSFSINAQHYRWWLNGVEVASGPDFSFLADKPGQVAIRLEATGSDPNCVERVSDTLQVLCPLHAGFTVNNPYPEAGETITFTANPSPAANQWSWTSNGGNIGNTPAVSVTLPEANTYNFCLTESNEYCVSTYCQAIESSGAKSCGTNFFKYMSAQYFLHGLAKLPDGTWLAGGSRQQDSMLLARISPDGVFTKGGYTNVFPGEKETLVALEWVSGGYVVGVGVSLVSTYKPADKMFVFKYDVAADTFVWLRSYAEVNFRLSVAWPRIQVKELPGDGNYLIGGTNEDLSSNYILITLDKTTGDILEGRILGQTAKQAPQEMAQAGQHLFVAGFDFSAPGGNLGARLTALTGTGQISWTKSYYHAGYGMSGSSLAVTDDAVYLLSKVSNGQSDADFEVTKVDLNGNALWSRLVVPDLPVNLYAYNGYKIVAVPDGVIAELYNTSPNEPYVHFFKFTADGNLVWNKTLEFPMGFEADELYPDGDDLWVLGRYLNAAYLPMLTRLKYDVNFAGPCLYYNDVHTNVSDQPVTVLNQTANPSTPVQWASLATSAQHLPANVAFQNICPVLDVCPEICNNGIDDDQDGYVDCYDQDCACFPALDCGGPGSGPVTARLAWQTPDAGFSWNVTPVVANLNPWADDMPEIIAVQIAPPFSIRFYRGDGANAQHPDLLPIPGQVASSWVIQPAVGDLDGDGRPELIAVDHDGFVLVFQNFTPGATPAMQLWLTSDLPAGDNFKRPQLADFDGDGISEIYAGNAIFKLNLSDPANAKLLKVLDANGAEGVFRDGLGVGGKQTAPTVADMLTVADCNGDPDCAGLELVAGNRIWSVDLNPLDGDGVQIKPARTISQAQWGDGYTAVADVDLDGTPDVVVNSRRTVGGATEWGLYVWDKNGSKYFLPHPIWNEPNGGGLPCIANVFDDRILGFAQDLPEIIAVSRNRLTCYNLNMAGANPQAPWFWSIDVDDPSEATACTVFDFNSDGQPEIVYRDESNLRILYGGPAPFPPGVDTDRNWWTTICGSATLDEYVIVADVDNDGQAEIAVAGLSEPYDPQMSVAESYLRVYESDGAPWAPARAVWNQFNYNSLQVNDDLSIPAQPQPHWLELPGPGSGKRPLNMHLAQVPVFDKNFDPAFPLADASVAADSFSCGPQDLYLRLRVCNSGSAPLRDSTPVQFYLSDPATTAAVPYGAPVYLPQKIGVDSCFSWNVQIPLPPAGMLWGLLNDKGDQPTPVSLSTSAFNPARSAECRYENNLFSLPVSYANGPLDLGPDTALCSGTVLTLDAGSGYAAYRWQDGATGSQYTVSDPGQYRVEAWDICGNKTADSILVSAIAAPTATRTIQLSPGQSITLNGLVYTPPGTVLVTQPAAPGGCDSLITYILELLPAPGGDSVCDVKTPPGCLRYELLGIRLDAAGQRRYRLRVTNTCASPLQYVCAQLPDGAAAVAPADGAGFVSPGGNNYIVRNPNASPFYSVRFKALSGGLNSGQSDIFEYALPQQSAPDYIHVYGKLADGSASEAHLNTFNCPVQPWQDVADRNTGKPESAPVALRVRPNPSSGYLLIDGHPWPEQALRLRVLNAQGQLVLEGEYAAGPEGLRVDLPDHLANGLYYLSVVSVDCAVVRFVLAR